MFEVIEEIKKQWKFTCDRCQTSETQNNSIPPSFWTKLTDSQKWDPYHLCITCTANLFTFMQARETPNVTSIRHRNIDKRIKDAVDTRTPTPVIPLPPPNLFSYTNPWKYQSSWPNKLGNLYGSPDNIFRNRSY